MRSRPPRIAFQGEPGAYGEDAVRALWGADAQPVPCPTFVLTLEAVRGGLVDGAVIPVANRIVGPVHMALDALDEHADGLRLLETVDIPVQHALLGVQGAQLEDIRCVVSHPVALAQCGRFLQTLGARTEEHEDTAGSARAVKERGDRSVASIASLSAAAQYGLTILARSIQDEADNWTRFLRVERGGA